MPKGITRNESTFELTARGGKGAMLLMNARPRDWNDGNQAGRFYDIQMVLSIIKGVRDVTHIRSSRAPESKHPNLL
jgi:hypothetical protein